LKNQKIFDRFPPVNSARGNSFNHIKTPLFSLKTNKMKKTILFFAVIITIITAVSAFSYADDLESLSGTIIEKPWSKTIESWNAGGSEYYVLKTENHNLPAEKEIILRPSEKVSFEKLASLKNKRVLVKGNTIEGIPYKNTDNLEQAPAVIKNPLTEETETLLRGRGFEVHEIIPLKN